ncbi:MAG TPA: MBL fold metallo-hydrolase [Ktedonobacteraceae bacterium]|nr:MBL fold metallo-hydrolase [Ktedonobacteraceae bacterium]
MTTQDDRPRASTAQVHVLFSGYAEDSADPAVSRVASSVGFVRDGEVRVIIDPGMVPDPASILEPLAALGESPKSITDVIFSHHHPDHTLNAALFPRARFHDYWAIYQGDSWESRPAEDYELAPSIRLIETPGHTPQDITTLVGTPTGVVAFTHLWWSAQGPAEDPLATDLAALHENRARVLKVATLIVPGHGAPFAPDAATPR